uniref:Uncharacterized protein n=1 Tax=Anguilla anguilla TaxID=7936 RepID=A0A0E9RC46_ANGAN
MCLHNKKRHPLM